jgi:MerR family transcriptional regulator, light-induced transcriptional regulator
MTTINQTPVYNLKAVLRETGLTADVLRAWERRYGLPKPERTRGGQRLYSQYDISLVKWLRARQEDGLSISRAVERWKETVEAGHDPLVDYPLIGSPLIPQPLAASNTQVEILQHRWLEACLAFDEPAADQALNQAFSLYPVEAVCTEFIQHGLSLIGDRWYHGETSVQQEHFASALATRRLETLIASTPPSTRMQTVLIGCPPGEFHTFPALLLTLFLRRRGLKLVYLGADVPAGSLVDTILVVRPDLVVLSAQRLSTAASLSRLAAQLQVRGIQTAYGGWVFNRAPSLRERIPAHFLGETIETALDSIDLLSVHPLPAPEVSVVPVPLASASRTFCRKRALIEAEVFASMQAQNLSTELLSMANNYLSADLTAALELGDPSGLAMDIEWIRNQMSVQNISTALLSAHLNAYQRAVRKLFGDESNVINAWFADFV